METIVIEAVVESVAFYIPVYLANISLLGRDSTL